MRLEDARRLTGPNLYGSRPLVLAEVVLEPGDALEPARRAYAAELNRLRAALELPSLDVRVVRSSARWAAFAFDAPLDEMLVGAEAAEWAGLSAADVLAGKPAHALEPKLTELVKLKAQDFDPRLARLEAEAARRGVPFLWDDESVSVGHGASTVSYPRGALPDVAVVPWDGLRRIPVALITGTNGKTTSTRLLARMVKEAGLAVGLSCSDSVTIGGEAVREGDWTGPAAARLVLRSPKVEVAVLETARGGILRRGLACGAADVALITNITDDHLGAYGVDDLDGMVEVKAVIAKVAKRVVLNARDPRLVGLAARLDAEVTWFADLDSPSMRGGTRASAEEAPHPALRATRSPLAQGEGKSVVCRDGWLIARDGTNETKLVPVTDVPITFHGTARYNVENALGATAAALALGLSPRAIIQALQTFGAADNPGRGETWTRDGVKLFIDFAHNPDGVRQALQVAKGLCSPSGHLHLITGSAGDRSDAELESICDSIAATEPSRVVLRELVDYLRGRAPGEIPALFRRALRVRGLDADQLILADSEVHALEQALRDAKAGDVIALLVHVDREDVQHYLATHHFHRG